MTENSFYFLLQFQVWLPERLCHYVFTYRQTMIDAVFLGGWEFLLSTNKNKKRKKWTCVHYFYASWIHLSTQYFLPITNRPLHSELSLGGSGQGGTGELHQGLPNYIHPQKKTGHAFPMVERKELKFNSDSSRLHKMEVAGPGGRVFWLYINLYLTNSSSIHIFFPC